MGRRKIGRRATTAHRRFWSEEAWLSSLLVILVVFHLALPLAGELGVGNLFRVLSLSTLAIAGVSTGFRRLYFRFGIRVIAVAALLAAWWEFAMPDRALVLVGAVVDATLVALLAVAVGAQVFKAGAISAHRVRGAIVVYLLIGSFFGLLYVLIVLLDPGAIRLTTEPAIGDVEALRHELSYFSFVTLVTLGFGDIVPVSPLARALTTLEAIGGQLYLAITIARLISSLRPDGGSGGDGRDASVGEE
jgi:hypothetical protein